MQIRTLLTALVIAGLTTPALADPDAWRREWRKTDFSRTSVADWDEIQSGGPPKDGIPAIDSPKLIPVGSEDKLGDREPVITVEMWRAQPRAYPVRYLIWHEIVNDTIGGVPVSVTFCPLCNSGMVFDRRTAHGVLTFGVSGKLRNSDMVMFDRETQSWWQQALGEAIVGQLTGTSLKALPAWMESWAEFKTRNPQGLVMAQPAYRRGYGRNPYVGYDSQPRPFLYNGENPPHGIPPLERVVRVGDRAWPLTRLSREGVIQESGVTIVWTAGQASALDTASISEGRDVGSIRVQSEHGRDIPHDVMFAFAFHAFWPGGQWMLAQ